MIEVPILIFAAGLGTRMRHLVRDKPKPLIGVGNTNLLDHALAQTRVEGVTKRVVNVHYKGQMIRDHLCNRALEISDESEALLETGGGLRKALPLLQSDPVATLNSDAIWRGPNPVTRLLESWRPEMEALLVLVPADRARGHKGGGDFAIQGSGRIVRGGSSIYSGLQLIRTQRVRDMSADAFSLNIVWDQMAADGGLFGMHYEGEWCDVGQPESLALANELLADENDV